MKRFYEILQAWTLHGNVEIFLGNFYWTFSWYLGKMSIILLIASLCCLSIMPLVSKSGKFHWRFQKPSLENFTKFYNFLHWKVHLISLLARDICPVCQYEHTIHADIIFHHFRLEWKAKCINSYPRHAAFKQAWTFHGLGWFQDFFGSFCAIETGLCLCIHFRSFVHVACA